jgi:hypothetical protein
MVSTAATDECERIRLDILWMYRRERLGGYRVQPVIVLRGPQRHEARVPGFQQSLTFGL